MELDFIRFSKPGSLVIPKWLSTEELELARNQINEELERRSQEIMAESVGTSTNSSMVPYKAHGVCHDVVCSCVGHKCYEEPCMFAQHQ